jgi:hypothetical protein
MDEFKNATKQQVLDQLKKMEQQFQQQLSSCED